MATNNIINSLPSIAAAKVKTSSSKPNLNVKSTEDSFPIKGLNALIKTDEQAKYQEFHKQSEFLQKNLVTYGLKPGLLISSRKNPKKEFNDTSVREINYFRVAGGVGITVGIFSVYPIIQTFGSGLLGICVVASAVVFGGIIASGITAAISSKNISAADPVS